MEEARSDLRGEIVDGRFRVEERLGSGGMGTVWRVQHVVSLQRFALKTLDPAYAAQPEATQRFLQEARAAAALRTRHVVKIIDAQMQYQHGQAPLPFLVMELLEGQTLQALLDTRGRLDPGELTWAAGQLGRALDAAHRQGIVHRDLKPSNVFVAEDEDGAPTIKLCDFGIAKLLGPATDGGLVTRTGALLGTPMYLAPELLRGAGAAVPATDQWSLGLIAFRALAGLEYFGHVKGFPELVLSIANDPLVPPSRWTPSLPAEFDAWFLRSCARNPEGRFPDVPSQVTALEAALGHPAPRPLALRSEAVPKIAAAPGAAPTNAADNPTGETLSPRTSVRPVARRRAKSPSRRIYFASAVIWAVSALAVVSWLAGHARPPLQLSRGPIALPAPPPPPPPSSPTPPPASPPPPPATKATAVLPAPVVDRARARSHAHRSPAPAPATSSRGLPKGASCRRSAECGSGLCAAETCQ